MPFEINEIDIRLRIGEGGREAAPAQTAAKADGGADSTVGGDCKGPDHVAVVDDVVRRVLRILRAQRER